MKAIFLALILVFALSSGAFADEQKFQYENFEWGISLEDVKKELNEKKVNFLKASEREGLGYNEKIMGEECNVLFYFTPKTKVLAQITLQWTTTGVGDGLKEVLTKKYGKPFRPNEYQELYGWGNIEDKDGIMLQYDMIYTHLSYLGGSFYKMLEAETKEINEKELLDKL